ncbi:MAG: HAMP domain-containing protein [Acidobacteriota bacterium]
MIGSAPIVAVPGATVATALALDSKFSDRIAAQVGLPVVLRSARPADANGTVRDGERYVSRQIFAAAGHAATIETALPRGEVALSLHQLERRFLLLALGVAALAMLSGLLLGRRIARPIQALDRAATRIGRGDFSSPIPEAARGETAEVGTLAATMEEMRRRLSHLTAELRRRQAEAEAVLTGIADGVFAVDRDRRIRYLNPQAAALLGVDPQAAIGRFCGDVLLPIGENGVRPCEEHCPIIHARFRGGARATESLRRNGGKRVIVITSSELAEEQQFQVIRDETGDETSRRLRDAVLANVSHEFKTPLAAQLASLELLGERLDELATSRRGSSPRRSNGGRCGSPG